MRLEPVGHLRDTPLGQCTCMCQSTLVPNPYIHGYPRLPENLAYDQAPAIRMLGITLNDLAFVLQRYIA